MKPILELQRWKTRFATAEPIADIPTRIILLNCDHNRRLTTDLSTLISVRNELYIHTKGYLT
jgi:hypothetical protein